MIVKELIQTAARSREYFDDDARRRTIAFIKSRWGRDGGVYDRDGKSDLYYTVFAAMGMRALNGKLPKLRLWNYLRSFGDGASFDIVHLFSLIRLRSIYPMSQATRNRLIEILDGKQADSAADMFFKVVMAECLEQDGRPEAQLAIAGSESTSNLAAAVVVNQQSDQAAEELLLQRYGETGGFHATSGAHTPDLDSTAKALFALRVLGANLAPLRACSLEFIESLRRENGGYASHAADDLADTENTFYALLSIGCLAE